MFKWKTSPALNDTLMVDGMRMGYLRTNAYSQEWEIVYCGQRIVFRVNGYSSKEEAQKDFELMFTE